MSIPLDVFGSPMAIAAATLVAKVTIILSLGAALAMALRSASSAVRHLVWSLTLGGTLAIVLLSAAAPPIVLHLPVISRVATKVSPSDRMAASVVTLAANGDMLRTSGGPSVRGGDRSPGGTIDGADARRAGPGAAAVVVALWLAGVLLVGGRIALGHALVARIVRSSETPVDVAAVSMCRSAAQQMQVRRPVRLLVSDGVASPITAGWMYPVVLLPRDVGEWAHERLRIVLTHELAHVARLDYLAQLVATIACALFWFHPGVWFAARRLRLEGEQAADDRVLASGTSGVSYATHLLEIARSGRATGIAAAAAVGMVRSTHFERRLRAMLDTSRPRSTVSRRRQAVIGAATLLALIPLAGVRTQLMASTVGDGSDRVAPSADRLIAPASSESLAPASPVQNASADLRASSDSLPNSVLLLSGTGRVVVTDAIVRVDSTFEQIRAASPGERLTIDLSSGGGVTLRAWDEPRVRLKARLDGEDWRATRVSFERVDGGVRLRTDYDSDRHEYSASHQFELWIPRRFDLRLSSAGGGLTILDVEGEFRGETGGGSIRIERAKGRASLSTGGGDIRVVDSDLEGRVSTGGGTVVLSNISGGLRGSSGSGPVVYADRDVDPGDARSASFARGSSRKGRGTGDLSGVGISADEITATSGVGPLHISKAGGSIVLDRMPRGGTVSTGGGGVTIGASAGSLDVSTGGGDVRLRNMAGDAHVFTGSGLVTISVINAGGTEHSLDVFSGTGRVEIELPRELDARLDIETAYTDNFGRRTKIESDVNLEREETTEWDATHGTPRRYVRGRATEGGGKGLIRIRTVNGDITIRRAPH